MAKYVILMNWTDQGVREAKNTVNRYHTATKLIESMGGSIESIYWTTGGYDIVVTASAPDDETLSASLLTLAGGGNLRTHTMRAFSEAEMQSIINKMP